MSKTFASAVDLTERNVSFTEVAPGCYAYVPEGDPNTGVIVGDDGVVVIDTQPTPNIARDVIARVREVTNKPVKYVVLTHYHATNALGASAYGEATIIASRCTDRLITERGEADKICQIGRTPRLFRGVEEVCGLTRPSVVFQEELMLRLGTFDVYLFQFGRGHTKGDTVVWVPDYRVLYSGDLVESAATPDLGDAYLREWPATLDWLAGLQAERLVPGRGAAMLDWAMSQCAISETKVFVQELFECVRRCQRERLDLQSTYRRTYQRLHAKYGHWVDFDHFMPFNVSRAYDEASGISEPRIWTDARDREMWAQLER